MRPWRFDLPEATPRIKVDISERDGSYDLKAEIPGVKKDDIDVRIDGNVVTITAEVKSEKEEKGNGGRMLRRERQEGYASRNFTLGYPVDEGKVQASYKDGVLALTLPKKPIPPANASRSSDTMSTLTAPWRQGAQHAWASLAQGWRDLRQHT